MRALFHLGFGAPYGLIFAVPVKMHFSGNCCTRSLLPRAGASHVAWPLTLIPGALAVQLGFVKTIVHCIWTCPISALCWRWCEFLLGLASANGTHNISLTPANIFVSWPLPAEWHIPVKLWQTLGPVVCWQIWKDRNGHFMAGKRSNQERIIRKSWQRLSTYLRKEWHYLLRKVDSGRLSVPEAEILTHRQFGYNPAIWNLNGMVLQVPPVPPRPP